MAENYEAFIANLDDGFYPEPNKSVFDELFEQYERVIFNSIITAFGLDLFFSEQYGGDVDTLNNVRKIGKDPNMGYKNTKNSLAYKIRGDYSHKDVEGKGTNFQRKKHDAREAYHENNSNTVEDAYTGKALEFLGKSKNHPTDKSAELDHVIAAKEIHDDRARVLAGVSTQELADAETNLQWTNEHLNKSMGADSIPDYIAKHPEMPEEQKQRMMHYYNQAKKAYESKLRKAYYLDLKNPNCQQFYIDTAKAAGKKGIQMGIRQVLGFILTEVWFAVKAEFQSAGSSMKEKLVAVGDGIQKGFHSAKNHHKEIIEKFGEGMLGGIISSLTTTLCNIFFTTSQNTQKIIRQSWVSITEATKILFFNPEERWLCDRMTAALKVLAAGAGMIIGTSVQEAVYAKLSSEVPMLGELNTVISTFCGSMCTGVLTVTLLVYIDNDPFDGYLEKAFAEAEKNARENSIVFYKYAAQLQGLDVKRFMLETEQAAALADVLCNTHDETAVTTALKDVMVKLQIESPWGDGTLDELMNTPNGKLIFKA